MKKKILIKSKVWDKKKRKGENLFGKEEQELGGECGGTSTVLVRGKVVGPAFFFVWGLMEESQGPKASINGCGKYHEKKEMLSGYFSSTSVSERNTAHCTLLPSFSWISVTLPGFQLITHAILSPPSSIQSCSN